MNTMKRDYTNTQVAEELKALDIRPSAARVNILRYLRGVTSHPTVDMIYADLLETLPGMSRTSVYNTLATLVKSGLVRPLTVDGNEMRYDAYTEDHGHFKCDLCGQVYDIDVDMSSIHTQDMNGFVIVQQDVFIRGLCPNCAERPEGKLS